MIYRLSYEGSPDKVQGCLLNCHYMTTGISSITYQHVAIVFLCSNTHSTKVFWVPTMCWILSLRELLVLMKMTFFPPVTPGWGCLPFLEDTVFRTKQYNIFIGHSKVRRNYTTLGYDEMELGQADRPHPSLRHISKINSFLDFPDSYSGKYILFQLLSKIHRSSFCVLSVYLPISLSRLWAFCQHLFNLEKCLGQYIVSTMCSRPISFLNWSRVAWQYCIKHCIGFRYPAWLLSTLADYIPLQIITG